MIISLTFVQVLLGSIILAALLCLVQWLLLKWIAARLEQSIRHEYEVKLEDYRFEQLLRQKAESVAALFSRWIKYRGHELELLSTNELSTYYEDLNRMSFELVLWVKDDALLNEIMHTLQLKEGATSDPRVLVGKIRRYIQNSDKNSSSTFDSNNITLWPKAELANKIFTADK